MFILSTYRFDLGDDVAEDVGRRGPRPAVPLLGVLVVGAAPAATPAAAGAGWLDLGGTGGAAGSTAVGRTAAVLLPGRRAGSIQEAQLSSRLH